MEYTVERFNLIGKGHLNKHRRNKSLWEMREFAKAYAKKLISRGTEKDTFSMQSFGN
jgi:hypothetical protein